MSATRMGASTYIASPAGSMRNGGLPMQTGVPRETIIPLSAQDDSPGRGTTMQRTDPDTARVVIAEGQTLLRGGLHALLDAEHDLTVVGDTSDGDEAVALAERECPDVMLIDIGLPGVDGLEVTRRILSTPGLEGLVVIVLSNSESDEHLFGALRAGASGFIAKDTQPGDLVEAVRSFIRGEALLSRRLTRRLIAEVASHPDRYRPSPDELEELTAREREVMTLVARGLNNDEIAERLVISVATAKTHVCRALRKVDARDRAQLVALAYETGLVSPRSVVPLPGAAGAPAPAMLMAA
jgi:DNA-binding NarL/FixJ family response regulator